jgi:hypothetical protein
VDSRSARLAQNEGVFRAGNEAIDSNLAAAGLEGQRPYLCECGDASCLARVALTGAEYEAIRAHPARFFVVPGHEDFSAGEIVVEETVRYTVVEKQDDERKVVERTDPRAA